MALKLSIFKCTAANATVSPLTSFFYSLYFEGNLTKFITCLTYVTYVTDVSQEETLSVSAWSGTLCEAVWCMMSSAGMHHDVTLGILPSGAVHCTVGWLQQSNVHGHALPVWKLWISPVLVCWDWHNKAPLIASQFWRLNVRDQGVVGRLGSFWGLWGKDLF